MEARVNNERSLDEAQPNPGPWQRIHRLPRIPADGLLPGYGASRNIWRKARKSRFPPYLLHQGR
jgi:hypothetical protein